MSIHYVNNYLKKGILINKRKVLVDKMREFICSLPKEEYPDFLVVRGTSGLLYGPIISHLLDIPLVVIRKPNDNSHSYQKHEIASDDVDLNRRGTYRYIIIDDMISSGNTIMMIDKGIKEIEEVIDDPYNLSYVKAKYKLKLKCTHILLYEYSDLEEDLISELKYKLNKKMKIVYFQEGENFIYLK